MLLMFFMFAQLQVDGCMKDTECKGDRICERGRCVDPTTQLQSGSAQSGSAQEKANTLSSETADSFELQPALSSLENECFAGRSVSACHSIGVDTEVGRNGQSRSTVRALVFYDRACLLGSKTDCTRSQLLKTKSNGVSNNEAASETALPEAGPQPGFPRVIRQGNNTCVQNLEAEGWLVEECRDGTGRSLGRSRRPNVASIEPAANPTQPLPAQGNKLAEEEWRQNVISVGGAVSVAFFPDPIGPAAGGAFSLTYEHAFAESVGIALAAVVAPGGGSPSFALGLGIPIYLTGRAPSGLALTPSASIVVTPIVVPAIGASVGYQFIAHGGFVFRISVGPSIIFIAGIVVAGISGDLALGYAF